MTSEPDRALDAEHRRLTVLAEYDILDSAAEQRFDDIARIAAQICSAPIALITLVDDRRQWIKARIGTELTETPRDVAFCAHAIRHDGVFEVGDAAADIRFADNPLVTGEAGIRFYAGVPLATIEGDRLGALCVLDRVPRQLSPDQREALVALSRQVMELMAARKQLAERREMDQRHSFILDSAVDYAIVAMKLDGSVTSWNEGAHRILGWTEAEMCGSSCHRFFTPEDREAGVPEREMSAALSEGRGQDERWHLKEDGTRFWANGEMMPLTDDADRPVGFIKILRDRTEQRLEYERLKAIEDRFALALDAAGFIGSWEWEIQQDRLRADAKFCTSFSVDPAEGEKGAPLATFIQGIHPDDREWVRDRIRNCIEETGSFSEEYRLRAPDGEVRWIDARGRCFYDEDGKPTHYPGIAIDITDRKLAELARGESETRARLALAAGELGTWEATPELENVRWDARARELLGHCASQELDCQHSFLRHVHPDDRYRVNKAVQAALAFDGTLDIEFSTVDEDGRQRNVQLLGGVFLGEPKRFLGTVRDVTEARAAEEHRALLTSELQHRVKNTLTVVQAIVSQSLRNAATPAEARATIADRLQVLSEAHDLLTRASWTAAPIDQIVDGAIQLQGGRSERIRVNGPDVRLGARSALALAMALHELGTNATKYGALSNPDGFVELGWMVEAGDEPRFELTWKEHGGPLVSPPASVGFGTRLMQSLSRDLGGEATLEYQPDGVKWCVRSSLAALADA